MEYLHLKSGFIQECKNESARKAVIAAMNAGFGTSIVLWLHIYVRYRRKCTKKGVLLFIIWTHRGDRQTWHSVTVEVCVPANEYRQNVCRQQGGCHP